MVKNQYQNLHQKQKVYGMVIASPTWTVVYGRQSKRNTCSLCIKTTAKDTLARNQTKLCSEPYSEDRHPNRKMGPWAMQVNMEQNVGQCLLQQYNKKGSH